VNVFGMPLGASDGGAAVESSQSRVSIHDSILLGGDGGIDSVLGSVDLAGGDGGAGLDATGELVVAVGGSATGGAAGASFGTGPTATGGSGVHLEGGATAWLRDIARVAGAAGDLPNSQSNQPGVPVSTPGPGNTVLTLGAPARSLVLDAVLPENGVAQMTVRGQPGDFVYLVFSLGGGFKAMFPRQGVLAMDLNTFFGPVPLFALPASGELTLPLVVPALPEPVAGGMVTWQAVFDAGTGQALIGAPTATAWVDESF
jgi:hypothetical protein